MEISRCDAVVLGVMDYREADRIVTLFTLEHGKIKGVARGAKRSIRRFGGALEPFARLAVQLALTGGLARIDGAHVATIHPRIREDLLKIGYAGYACEAADLLLRAGRSALLQGDDSSALPLLTRAEELARQTAQPGIVAEVSRLRRAAAERSSSKGRT
jgi:hypothetical protein